MALLWNGGVCVVAIPILLGRQCKKKSFDLPLCLQGPWVLIISASLSLAGVDVDED
jgi:hypothetical protein